MNLKVGDLVILMDEGRPPTFWSLGRVVNVYPGADGLIRNATVRISVGLKDRAIQKLCVLPPSKEDYSTSA